MPRVEVPEVEQISDDPAVGEQYRLLFESSLGLVCIHLLDGRLVTINPAGARSLGYEPRELVGRPLTAVVASEYHPAVAEYLDTMREVGTARGILRVVRRDGEQRLWAYANRRVRDKAGSFVLGHAQDVTDLFRVRAQLRRLSELDSATGLPNRRSFQVLLEEAVDDARRRQGSLTVLLVNPLDFRGVNERFGRPAGDRVLEEIGHRLRAHDDVETAHYGGATFAGLIYAEGEAVAEVAHGLYDRLRGDPYTDGAVRLDFNVGLAPLACEEEDGARATSAALVQRASWALQQAASRGGGVVVADAAGESIPRVDRLQGIFTTEVDTDYRNMLLMWNVLAVLSRQADPREIAAHVLRVLVPTFSLAAGHLIAWSRVDEPEWVVDSAGVEPLRLRELDLPSLRERLHAPDARTAVLEEVDGERRVVVPLVSPTRPQGLLLLAGEISRMSLEPSDLRVLEGLAVHVASALERAALAEGERRRQEQQSELLEREVEELRTLVKRTKLVYSSPTMREVVEKAGRIAAADATVLVTGESGTGKEVIAKVIHDLSPRRTREPVVVDLAAMTPSVIESELFGHVQGAFTGADRAAPGRLLQAHGSTVILDEIGELPLAAQAKLLRFVQEKQIVPVGGHEAREVDARIVACTNRDLAAEVEGGRFRADLYYRLNVLRLHLPRLSARREDVPVLAEHFLHQFATQHQRRCTLAPDALDALVAHDWPGNVRELQNRLLRAVVLSSSPVLDAEAVGLPAGNDHGILGARGDEESFVAELRRVWGPRATSRIHAGSPPRGSVAPDGGTGPALDLRDSMERVLEAELGSPPPLAPLGRWLAEELIRAASEAAGGVASRAADLLDLAESTYRRRLAALEDEPPARPEHWLSLRPLLVRAIETRGGAGSGLFVDLQETFWRVIVARLEDDPRRAASIVGVSMPTLRRWRKRQSL